MKVLCLNVWGINSPRKQLELKNFVQKFNGDLICLVETKVKETKAVEVAKSICPC